MFIAISPVPGRDQPTESMHCILVSKTERENFKMIWKMPCQRKAEGTMGAQMRGSQPSLGEDFLEEVLLALLMSRCAGNKQVGLTGSRITSK